MMDQHQKVKQDAIRLWGLVDHPVYDSSRNPELGFSAEAVAVAKRGRRNTAETALIGGTETKKAARGHERSARRYGINEEVERLRGYPTAMEKYHDALQALQCGGATDPKRTTTRRKTGWEPTMKKR